MSKVKGDRLMKKAIFAGVLIGAFAVVAVISTLYVFMFSDYVFFEGENYEPSETVLMLGEAFETGDEYERDNFGAVGRGNDVEEIFTIGEGGLSVYLEEPYDEVALMGIVQGHFLMIYLTYSESMMRDHVTLYGESIVTSNYSLEMWGQAYDDEGYNTEMTLDEVKEELENLTLEDVMWLIDEWE